MKKSFMKRLVALALVIVSVFSVSAVAFAEYNTMYIDCPVGETVRLREGPGTSYGVLTNIRYGTAVQAEYYNSSWYKVKYNGYTGYMMDDFLSTTRPSEDDDTYGYIPYLGGTGSSANLSRGDEGPAVKNLQLMLRELRYLNDSADGIFGTNTKSAVVNFQAAHGLTADGIVGKATKGAIWEALGEVAPNDCVILN